MALFSQLLGPLVAIADVQWSWSFKPVYEDCSVDPDDEGGAGALVAIERSSRVCLWEKQAPAPIRVLGFYGNPLRITFSDTDADSSRWSQQLMRRYQGVLSIAKEVCTRTRQHNLQGESLTSDEFQEYLSTRISMMRSMVCPVFSQQAHLGDEVCAPLWLLLLHSPPSCKSDPVRTALKP